MSPSTKDLGPSQVGGAASAYLHGYGVPFWCLKVPQKGLLTLNPWGLLSLLKFMQTGHDRSGKCSCSLVSFLGLDLRYISHGHTDV